MIRIEADDEAHRCRNGQCPLESEVDVGDWDCDERGNCCFRPYSDTSRRLMHIRQMLAPRQAEEAQQCSDESQGNNFP